MTKLYSKPGCVQCAATERYLKQHNKPYEKIDLTKDEAAFDHVVNTLGYQNVPVVETAEGKHWYGFNPDELALL